jgi:hypothetical protein
VFRSLPSLFFVFAIAVAVWFARGAKTGPRRVRHAFEVDKPLKDLRRLRLGEADWQPRSSPVGIAPELPGRPGLREEPKLEQRRSRGSDCRPVYERASWKATLDARCTAQANLQERLLKVVVGLCRNVVVLKVLLAVEGDGLGLDLALLYVDLVSTEDDGDVFADTDQITCGSLVRTHASHTSRS